MNCVRKHLSAIKGGRLAAAACPARVVTLVISDVPGDDPVRDRLGPDRRRSRPPSPMPAPSSRKYGIDAPAAVDRTSASGDADETPKPGDPRLPRVETVMIATPQMSLEAAAEVARRPGVDAAHPGRRASKAKRARSARSWPASRGRSALHGQPRAPPVRAALRRRDDRDASRGNGRGGRNVEFLLSLAVALDGHAGIFAVAGDTDGIDGARTSPARSSRPTRSRAPRQARLRRQGALADNDGHGFFEALGDQLVTGPTLTNVNDFRAILIAGQRRRRQPHE